MTLGIFLILLFHSAQSILNHNDHVFLGKKQANSILSTNYHHNDQDTKSAKNAKNTNYNSELYEENYKTASLERECYQEMCDQDELLEALSVMALDRKKYIKKIFEPLKKSYGVEKYVELRDSLIEKKIEMDMKMLKFVSKNDSTNTSTSDGFDINNMALPDKNQIKLSDEVQLSKDFYSVDSIKIVRDMIWYHFTKPNYVVVLGKNPFQKGYPGMRDRMCHLKRTKFFVHKWRQKTCVCVDGYWGHYCQLKI